MQIIIIPPEVTDIKSLQSKLNKNTVCFLADPFSQRGLFDKQPVAEGRAIGLEDVVNNETFKDVNHYTRHFARNWFRLDEVKEVFRFRGVNLAGQLIIEFGFYFIKALKAICTCEALFDTYKKGEFFLADDDSTYSKICKYI